MLNNDKVTPMAIAGVALLSVGTILGLVGVSTYDWVQAPLETVNTLMPGVGTFLYEEIPDSTCRVGLFEVCCSPPDVDECVGGIYSRVVSVDIGALRICLVVAIVLMAVCVVLLLAFMFKDLRYRTAPAQQGLSLLMAIATILYMMVAISYTMVEYKADPGLFTYAGGASFEWSFGLAIAGALINPIGVFLICTQWHRTEDLEAGVEADYDGKFTQNTYI